MKSSARLLGVCSLALWAVGCGAGDPPGPPAASDERREAIVGGYLDEETTGAVGLALDFAGLFFTGHCSATLIAQNVVMTARHCIALTQNNGPQNTVVCGQTGFGYQGQGSYFLASPLAVRPLVATDPSFYRGTEVRPVPGANDSCGFDVALIILEGQGIPPDVAKPIVPRIDSLVEQGELFSAIGYGLQTPGGSDDGTRMRTDGNVVSCVGYDCPGALGSSVRDTEWVGNSQVCPGDSGGPAIDEMGRVVGVTSRGPDGCIDTVYGDVGSWGDFIIQTTLDAAQMAGIDPPFWALTKKSIPEDVTGQACGGSSGPCLNPDYSCHHEDGAAEDAGICVPPCDPVAAPECPPDFMCSSEKKCVPEPDPLGEPCTGPCHKGFVCYAADGGDTGECMPPCGADGSCADDGYECVADFGACLTTDAVARLHATGSKKDSGCALAPRSASDPAGSVPWIAGLAGVLGGVARRRRRRPHASRSTL